ncbi:Shedu immune nuclease family protein [Pseudonocardia hierapolitana]|uniref:Shedu immune nuclease family protein n=1 Tax=Pseudonocardia hierapolitana TaxID=1128676 RepID=UPI001FE38969|nr:Shedu immune nuclease family protein [Pseudonocardia hierapolitana]
MTLIKKDDEFSPRIKLWKKNMKGPGKDAAQLEIPDLPETRQIKALVDTSEAHKEFWELIDFIRGFKGVSLPVGNLRIIDADSAQIASMLQATDRTVAIDAVRMALGSSLTDQDIALIANRKEQLRIFERLLHEDAYFAEVRERLGVDPEELWQRFFEKNQWIFGYGLQMVTTEAIGSGKLERYTTGANVFEGAGKRSDAIMRTRGFVSSLLFCEIKRHDTELLARAPYRKPDVYRPSAELTGSVAQVQKTARKALRTWSDQIKKMFGDDGTPLGLEVSTSRPRQVVLIGSLKEFDTPHGINGEKIESFELFRTSVADTEVITFDELLERARFIVQDRARPT